MPVSDIARLYNRQMMLLGIVPFRLRILETSLCSFGRPPGAREEKGANKEQRGCLAEAKRTQEIKKWWILNDEKGVKSGVLKTKTVYVI